MSNPKVPYVALLIADTVSSMGSRISTLAIPWLIWVTTASPSKMGIAVAAEMLPYVLTGVLAAPIADRVGLRRTIIAANIASAVAMAAIAGLPGMNYVVLLVLVAVAGGLRGIADRSKNVINRPIAKAAGIPIVRMTALYEGFTKTATLVGAPVGGLLIYWLGARGAVWFDAASFAFCALLVIALVKMPPADPAEPAASPTPTVKEPYFTALKGGFAHLAKDRLVFALVLITTASNLFTQAFTVFVPLWVGEVLKSPAALGLISSALAAGGVLGGAVFIMLATKLPRYVAFTVGLIVGSAPRLLVMGLSHNLALVLVVTFLAGFAISSVNPIMGAMLYERTPAQLQTRVFGVAAAVSFIGIPLGGLLAGWSVDGLGLNRAILVSSIVLLAVSLLPLLFKERWAAGQATPAPAAPAPAPVLTTTEAPAAEPSAVARTS
ncbi:MFS transporter [Catellatospora sp. KI3]|uniref:MFS transporter n=1 Tax=Catellatospora sp. KI3 TaxID=3041620 RepID=UPI0024821454|nr:MFS transporter [Catellatospora sp. KI3]MDI1461130.1 MFS transporter [Catellatospora sp. KI3]